MLRDAAVTTLSLKSPTPLQSQTLVTQNRAAVQVIRDSSPDLPTLLEEYKDYGGVCVFETIFGCGSAGTDPTTPAERTVPSPPATTRAVFSGPYSTFWDVSCAVCALPATGRAAAPRAPLEQTCSVIACLFRTIGLRMTDLIRLPTKAPVRAPEPARAKMSRHVRPQWAAEHLMLTYDDCRVSIQLS